MRPPSGASLLPSCTLLLASLLPGAYFVGIACRAVVLTTSSVLLALSAWLGVSTLGVALVLAPGFFLKSLVTDFSGAVCTLRHQMAGSKLRSSSVRTRRSAARNHAADSGQHLPFIL